VAKWINTWKSFWQASGDARARRTRLLAAFVVLAALGNVRLLRVVRSYYAADRPPDLTALALERFANLQQDATIGAPLGYFSDPRWSASEREAALDRARFALSPRLVVFGLEQDLVVADFPNGEPPGIPASLQLIRDFGQGVRLYHNPEAH